MKHHFGDMLDRSGGHWTFLPNVQRYAFHMPEWTSGQKLVSIATISSEDKNWELISTFPNLEELTLHSPSHEQMAYVSNLWRLKRLRITHARPKSLAFISRLQNLEEIILEYVSGFDEISPLGQLSNLRALHIENVRRVSDFSGIKNARSLKYLSIDGTLDWDQPVDSFDFLGDLAELEILRLMKIRPPKAPDSLASILRLKKLSKLSIYMSAFPIEVFAWIQAKLPNIEGAVRPAFMKFGGENQQIRLGDYRARLPLEEFMSSPGRSIGPDGKRYQWIGHSAALLGKGQRGPTGSKETVDRICDAHAEKYMSLIEKFRD